MIIINYNIHLSTVYIHGGRGAESGFCCIHYRAWLGHPGRGSAGGSPVAGGVAQVPPALPLSPSHYHHDGLLCGHDSHLLPAM